MQRRSSTILALLFAWVLLIAVVAPFDIPVARGVAGAHWPDSIKWLLDLLRWPGNFIFTMVIAGILLVFHPWKWRAGGLLCLSGIMSGLLTVLLKWFVGRTRPPKSDPPFAAFSFHPFKGGPAGLFTEKNQSFPSGDVCLAFATAECLSLFFPRYRLVFYFFGLLVAFARVSANAHYVTDTLVGAGVGIFAAHLTWYLCRLIFDRKLEGDAPHPTSDALPAATASSER